MIETDTATIRVGGTELLERRRNKKHDPPIPQVASSQGGAMRHRISRRQWKRRCERGDAIPLMAIVDHRLNRWFRFAHPNGGWMREFYYAERLPAPEWVVRKACP
jgi:hypothetical protein